MKKRKSIVSLSAAIAVFSASVLAAEPTLIENGGFDNGKSTPWETPGWWAGGTGTSGVDGRGRFCTTVTTLGTAEWGVQLRQNEKTFEEGQPYQIRFKAWSSAQTSVVIGAIDETVTPALVIFDSPSEPDQLITVGLDDINGQDIEYNFIAAASTDKARIRFMMGGGIIPEGETLCLDDVVVVPPPKNLLTNGNFDDDANGWEVPGWWAGGSGSSGVDNEGRMCTTVTTEGTADWGAQLRQVGKKLIAGRTYTVNFDAWSSADINVTYDAIDEPAGYQILLSNYDVAVSSRLNEAPTHFSTEHAVSTDSSEANFRFLLGGGKVPAGETFCVDNVELLDPEGNSVIQPVEPEVAAVFANQHGYLPALEKLATYKLVAEDFNTARTWNLLDSTSQVVASGSTEVIGADTNSGDVIHQIDFSDYRIPGKDYRLEVVEGTESILSHPFDISNELFETLKYEALSYFYHNRSGIDILETVVADPKWARPAGHMSDAAIETFVCKEDPTADTCRVLDASGGWYDAGDHGKYVVNGGISVWTLLNQYERSEKLGRNSQNFDANSMALPVEETSNELPDILDEAKWEIEWMLKMQIPAGETFAGMAYHKLHDDGWTGLGLAPHEDPQVRYVQAPTTAATLNLAAVGAQCYRVYKDFDAEFADRCLTAAKQALKAAKENPDMFAGKPAEDDPNPERFSVTNDNGGGMYDDDEISDEMFWAIAELYASTKNEHYKKALVKHELYGRYALVTDDDSDNEVPPSLFYWGNTNMLGAISIATVGDALNLKKSIVDTQIDLLVAAADKYVDVANEPGYSLPMNSDMLDWGSNSGLVNNMIVLGIVNDVTCEQSPKYINAMSTGLAYLMGNNPLGISFVTGYGEVAVEQPHHRFWANAENAAYPTPPPGVMSGGPNSGHATTGDPVSIAKLDANCAPETCFIDHIGSWSTNEITINWNAPFAWAIAYMDELSDYGQATKASCDARPKSGSMGTSLLLGVGLLLLFTRKKLH